MSSLDINQSFHENIESKLNLVGHHGPDSLWLPVFKTEPRSWISYFIDTLHVHGIYKLNQPSETGSVSGADRARYYREEVSHFTYLVLDSKYIRKTQISKVSAAYLAGNN